jgi:hypothetical protein
MKSIKTSKVTQFISPIVDINLLRMFQKSIEDLCCKIARLQSSMSAFSKEDMKELDETISEFLANLPESLDAYVADLGTEENPVAASFDQTASIK